MLDTRIILCGIWIALMLVYFLGDVLRIFSGDYKEDPNFSKITKGMYFGISILMLTPILMIIFTLTLEYNLNRLLNIVMAIFWLIFNLIGLPSYKSSYDKFLIIVGLLFNVLTLIYAWNWAL